MESKNKGTGTTKGCSNCVTGTADKAVKGSKPKKSSAGTGKTGK